jgi:undecaprenyl-diphosphatase
MTIASLRLAPSPNRRTLSVQGALAVGVVHGAALFPGASRVGAALVLLLWLGLRPARALDLAILITIPSLLGAFASTALIGAPSVPSAAASLPLGLAALGVVVAFVSAAIGVSFLRTLLMTRRAFALALWTIPLGLATIAYARALPSAAMESPAAHPPTTTTRRAPPSLAFESFP